MINYLIKCKRKPELSSSQPHCCLLLCFTRLFSYYYKNQITLLFLAASIIFAFMKAWKTPWSLNECVLSAFAAVLNVLLILAFYTADFFSIVAQWFVLCLCRCDIYVYMVSCFQQVPVTNVYFEGPFFKIQGIQYLLCWRVSETLQKSWTFPIPFMSFRNSHSVTTSFLFQYFFKKSCRFAANEFSSKYYKHSFGKCFKNVLPTWWTGSCSLLPSIWGILCFMVNTAAAPTLPQGAQNLFWNPQMMRNPTWAKLQWNLPVHMPMHSYAIFLQGGTTFVSLEVARTTVFFPFSPSHKVVL